MALVNQAHRPADEPLLLTGQARMGALVSGIEVFDSLHHPARSDGASNLALSR